MAADILILIESLDHLVRALDPARRHLVLERALTRARRLPAIAQDMDVCRFHMAGLRPSGPPPLAAIRRLGDLPEARVAQALEDRRYWLAVDPVTLTAGLKSLMLMTGGTAHMAQKAIALLTAAVRETLALEGLELEAPHTDRWYVAVEEDPGFDFVSPYEAMGLGLVEVLPDHPGAGRWRRIANEIQMVLHAHPVNQDLRSNGRPEINSVWFWGGGRLPEAATRSRVQRCFSDDPIMRGLARLHGLDCLNMDDWRNELALAGAGPQLIDWQIRDNDAEQEIDLLEALIDAIVPALGHDIRRLEIHSPIARWQLTRSRLRRFWRRNRPLTDSLMAQAD